MVEIDGVCVCVGGSETGWDRFPGWERQGETNWVAWVAWVRERDLVAWTEWDWIRNSRTAREGDKMKLLGKQTRWQGNVIVVMEVNE